MIIGLTGKNGAGKGEVLKVLEKSGFHPYSLSDIIREEVAKKNLPVTRDILIETGNKLRLEGGASILAEKLMAKLDPEKNYVVDSIRNSEEVRSLRRRPDFSLVKVLASPQIRFQRIKDRKRENDPQTLEAFMALEKTEAKGGAHEQQIDHTEALADYEIYNEGTLDELTKNARDLVRQIALGAERPSWDVYFMDIAKMVALRSNCLKRKVAAVIVKDKRIISTGYNGTPRGIKNCNEGGCPRCHSFGESGANLGECLCSHAEENSIVQASYHGVSLKDATLYTTFSPCLLCTKMIINSGIREVVYNAVYPMSELPLQLLATAYIQVRKV